MKLFRLLAVSILVLTSLGAGIQDYLADMKTTMKDVESYVRDNFAYGSFYCPSACALIPAAKRAAVVRAAGEFARSYVTTAAFKSWYGEYREQQKPEAPTLTPSMGDSRSQQVAAMKQQIAEIEKNMANAPAEQRGMFKDLIATLKSNLKELQNGDTSQDGEMNKMIDQSNADAKAEYAQKLAAFEREFPKDDPRPLIRRRLKAFLEQTENIDFGAKLQKKGKFMVFVNPDYENRSSEWKKAFRAGKEATEAARAFAREWLKSL